LTLLILKYPSLQSKARSPYCQKIANDMPLGEKVMGFTQVLVLQSMGQRQKSIKISHLERGHD
jgi:hypothetical protein